MLPPKKPGFFSNQTAECRSTTIHSRNTSPKVVDLSGATGTWRKADFVSILLVRIRRGAVVMSERSGETGTGYGETTSRNTWPSSHGGDDEKSVLSFTLG